MTVLWSDFPSDMLLCIPCKSGQVFCLCVLDSPRAVCILVALY